MPNLSPLEREAWRGFLHTHAAVWKALDAELAKDDLSMPAYELLLTLQEAGDGGVRMSDLARTLRFSGGGLTRLVDRLERQGYVARRRCPEDGRGFDAVLTPSGERDLRRVHARHVRHVRTHVLDLLDDDDLRAMARVWAKVARAAA